MLRLHSFALKPCYPLLFRSIAIQRYSPGLREYATNSTLPNSQRVNLSSLDLTEKVDDVNQYGDIYGASVFSDVFRGI